jgi:hypothetical protein
MSDHPTSSGTGHGHDPHGKQIEDSIDYGTLIKIGVASLVIFALATWWASIIWRRETARVEQESGRSKPVELGRAEIGIVDQVPFVSDHRLDEWRKERKQRLDSYGWVDRARGIAHIPIDEAMKKVAGGASPAGAPR